MQSGIQWIFRAAAVVSAALATAQPLLGSFSFFRRADGIDYGVIHTVAGAGIYYSSILLAVLAAFTGFRRRWFLLAFGVVQVIAVHGQLLLGVESNDDAGLLAFHIPLGVLIFLLSYVIAGLSFGARLESSRA